MTETAIRVSQELDALLNQHINNTDKDVKEIIESKKEELYRVLEAKK